MKYETSIKEGQHHKTLLELNKVTKEEPIYIHTYITCIHTYIHPCMHTCVHAYMRGCMRACIHACMRTCMPVRVVRVVLGFVLGHGAFWFVDAHMYRVLGYLITLLPLSSCLFGSAAFLIVAMYYSGKVVNLIRNLRMDVMTLHQ